jgi:hypothetical protein
MGVALIGHSLQLIQPKKLAVQTRPQLPKEYLPFVLQHYQTASQQKQGQRSKQQRPGQQHIKQTFAPSLVPISGRRVRHSGGSSEWLGANLLFYGAFSQ